MSLKGRIAIVTGGGRGIGKAIALGLADDGADIAIFFRKDEPAAFDTVKQIEAKGRKARAYAVSVDSFEKVQEGVERVVKEMGPIGILINNAGIASRGLSVADTDPAEMERVVRTHGFGPFYASKAVLPSMRTQKRGDIIMISSLASRHNGANGAPYNMGKATMEAVAFTLAKEEVKHNIRVNIVAPPLTDTEMGKRLALAAFGVKDDIHELDAKMPFGHVCAPEDIANVVRFLVSEQNSYVSGQRIYVDGGTEGARPTK